MNRFNELYEKVMRHDKKLNLKHDLKDKPLTMIYKGSNIKVFGYTLQGDFKELLSVEKGSTGYTIARNFIYKNSPLNYYYHDNKKIKLPHWEDR